MFQDNIPSRYTKWVRYTKFCLKSKKRVLRRFAARFLSTIARKYSVLALKNTIARKVALSHLKKGLLPLLLLGGGGRYTKWPWDT